MDCFRSDSVYDGIRCYIRKDDGTYVNIMDDFDKSSTIVNQMDFFYWSANDKMTHLPYDFAINTLKRNIDDMRMNMRSPRRRTSFKKSKPPPRASSSSTYDSEVEAKQRSPCIKKNCKESPIECNIQVGNSRLTNFSSIPKKKANLECQLIINRIPLPSTGDNVISKSPVKNKTPKYKIPVISPGRLKLIKRWLHKNYTMAPIGVNDENTESIQNSLYALNPVVKIRKISWFDKNNQKDFLHTLGLEQVPFTSQKLPKVGDKKVLNTKNSVAQTDFDSKKKLSPNVCMDKFNVLKNWTHKTKPKRSNDNGIKIARLPNIKTGTTAENLVPIVKKNSFIRTYTIEEDMRIIKFILEKNYTYLVNGNNMWKELQKENDVTQTGNNCTTRTWQSLRNRFLRVILFHLRDYGLSTEDEMKIKVGARKGSINQKKFSDNYGLVISNKVVGRENTKISPSRITSVKMPSRDYIRTSLSIFSDSDELIDNEVQLPYKEYITMQKKRKLFSKKSYIKSSSSSSSSSN